MRNCNDPEIKKIKEDRRTKEFVKKLRAHEPPPPARDWQPKYPPGYTPRDSFYLGLVDRQVARQVARGRPEGELR